MAMHGPGRSSEALMLHKHLYASARDSKTRICRDGARIQFPSRDKNRDWPFAVTIAYVVMFKCPMCEV